MKRPITHICFIGCTLTASSAIAGTLGAPGDLYVASQGTDEVLQYNGTTGEFVGVFVPSGSNGLLKPRGLVFGPHGNLFVVSFGTDSVLVFDGIDGTPISTFVGPKDGLDNTAYLAFGPNGNLFVTSRDNSKVIEFDGKNGDLVREFVGGAEFPKGLVFRQNGNLLVSTSFEVIGGPGMVVEYDPEGAFLGVLVEPGSGGLNTPQTMQFRPNGNLLVVSNGSHSVIEFDGTNGNLVGEFANEGLQCTAVSTYGPDGNLYVSNNCAPQNIVKIDGTSGALLGVFVDAGSGGLSAPIGVEFKPACDGPVFVVHGMGQLGETRPFSGYVDPRAESTTGEFVDLGVTEVVFVFNDLVQAVGGGHLTTASFITASTGGEPPTIGSVDDSENPLVRITFGTPPPLNEWTTITAIIENLCGNPIESLGDLGPGVEEPDRIDFLFLPCDVDQSGEVGPFDLLRFRQIVNEIVVPTHGTVEDYVDTNRTGEVTPFDLLMYRQLINGTIPATRAWAGESANHPQP